MTSILRTIQVGLPGIIALLCSSALALPPPLAEPIPAAPYIEIEIPDFDGTATGTPVLERVTDETLFYTLEVAGQDGAEVTLRGDLGHAEAGVYYLDIPRTGGDDPFRRLAAIHRTPELLVAGPAAQDSSLPFRSGVRLTNAEWLILPHEVGRAGTIARIDFFVVPGSGLPAGDLTVRLKETPLESFADDQLDPSGWQTVYEGPLPEPSSEGVVAVTLQSLFALSATESLHLSVIVETESPDFGESVRQVDGRGEARFRAGIAASSAVPPEEWSGGDPPLRFLEGSIPLTRLRFIGSAVEAGFDAEERTVAAGEPVRFLNLSSPNVLEWSWDLLGDGQPDSTAEEPLFAYPAPGEYTVELTVSDGFAQGARLEESFIEVLPATGLPGDWLRYR